MDSSEVAGNLRLASAIRNGSTGVLFNLPQIGVGVADPRLEGSATASATGLGFVVALPSGRGSATRRQVIPIDCL